MNFAASNHRNATMGITGFDSPVALHQFQKRNILLVVFRKTHSAFCKGKQNKDIT
jgi:hypothetical protein